MYKVQAETNGQNLHTRYNLQQKELQSIHIYQYNLWYVLGVANSSSSDMSSKITRCMCKLRLAAISTRKFHTLQRSGEPHLHSISHGHCAGNLRYAMGPLCRNLAKLWLHFRLKEGSCHQGRQTSSVQSLVLDDPRQLPPQHHI